MPKGVGQSNMCTESEAALKTFAVNEPDDVILALQAREAATALNRRYRYEHFGPVSPRASRPEVFA